MSGPYSVFAHRRHQILEGMPAMKEQHAALIRELNTLAVAEQMGFNLGNAFKYLWRRDQKIDAIEDMKKARWYLSREIKRLKRAMLEQRAHFEAWSMHEPESELKQAMAEIFIGAHLVTERMNAIREAIALIDGELHKRGEA